MCKRRNYKKASFTVEISILMPFLVIVILLFFYFVLYMYNRGIMQNALCRGAKQIFYNINEDNQTIENTCSRKILEDLRGSLIAVKDIDVATRVSFNEVVVELEGALDTPGILELEPFHLEGIWKYQLEWREPRLHAAEMLLYGQQIDGVFEEIGEGEESNEKEEIQIPQAYIQEG